MMEDHLNVMRREAERMDARTTTWATGAIDSYDKKTHSAKVKLQPEGVLSGWLPLNSLAVGSGFGIHGAPKVGDPVLVHFQEGDREAGIIMGRFFTDKHPPVQVEEGEYLIRHEKGHRVYFDKDGNLKAYGSKSDDQHLFLNSDGSAELKESGGASIKLKDDLVTVDCAKFHITRATEVLLEDGASDGVEGGGKLSAVVKVKGALTAPPD